MTPYGNDEGEALMAPNDRETVGLVSTAAIKRWIDNNMKYKRYVVVLIGSLSWVRQQRPFGNQHQQLELPPRGHLCQGREHVRPVRLSRRQQQDREAAVL